MKTNKRTLAILTAGLLIATPVVSTGITAFADTITVNNSTSGYSYSAYKIFSGDISGGKLIHIDWAPSNEFNSATFITKLQADSLLGTDFSNISSANDAVLILIGYNETTDVAKLAQFAKLAKECVVSAAGTQNAQTGTTYPITVSDSGYYLIEETNSDSDEPISRYMLKVAGDTTVDPKRPQPSLTKVITNSNPNDDGSANTASIGDIVSYEITSAVPDRTGYDKYFFIINDTLESGLSFNESSVAVSIGETPLTKNTDYYIKTTGIGSKTFEIVFNNFINRTEAIGTPITVTYNATVNNNATAGNSAADANTNTASLTYSNNPNITSDGHSDYPNEPDSDDPVGKTPDQTTYTYLTEIVIEKVDKTNHNVKLPNAKFELTGASLNSVLHESGLYVKNNAANPAYYLLTDGTYTLTPPTTPLPSTYISDQKYAFTIASSVSASETKVTAYGESDATGILTFGKLGEGTYTIIETAPPTGYNKLSAPIKVEITATPSSEGCSWTYTPLTGGSFDQNKLTIENASGATLPSTGGIGTKLFYIIGSLLVLGSIVLLVTKKRMGSKEN